MLELRSNNTAHRPVLDALELIWRYAHQSRLTYYPVGETVPAHSGIDEDWRELLYKPDNRGRVRVLRMAYEIATLQALRDQLRCKEIWVVGADRWRNPGEDLPPDFEQRRGEHYAALSKPLDPSEFIEQVRGDLRSELEGLHRALPELPFLEIADRGNRGAGVGLAGDRPARFGCSRPGSEATQARETPGAKAVPRVGGLHAQLDLDL